MNGKCIFRGKNFFASALFVAILAAMALLFSCGGGSASSGDSYVSGDFGTGGNGTGGGDNTGNEGEGNGGENGNESGDGDEQSGNEQPTMKKDLEQLLKYYMTEAVYNSLSGKIEPANKINLSAQTIKDAGTIFPVLQDIVKEARTEEYFNSKKPSKITTTENDLNKALIVLEKGYIDIQQSKLSILKKLNLEGSYDLSEIEIDNSSSLGDFSTATFTGSNITVDKINTARGTSFPTLNVGVKAISNDNKKNAENIYKIYKEYSVKEKLSNVQLSGNLSDYVAFDGKEISGASDYTLFENDTEAKDANNSSIISLSADAMVQMTDQLKIYEFDNIIVSGSPSKSANIDWLLVNIVFEDDMNTITNNGNFLYGIVYFKGKTYNTPNSQKLQGMLKLDDLSNNKFNISGNEYFSVIDVRNISEKDIDEYKGGVCNSGNLNSVYFGNFDETSNKDYLGKFISAYSYLSNAYYKGERRSGYKDFTVDNRFFPSSRIPRSLKDFEALGNSYIDSNGENMKFPTSARDSYNDTQFNSLDSVEQQKLNADKNLKELAKNDKRIDSRIV